MQNRFDCDGDLIHKEAVAEVAGKMLSETVFADAATFFKVMGDGTRFKILWALDKRELCVCDLASLLGMSRSAVSHQLARLRENKLVTNRREGKRVLHHCGRPCAHDAGQLRGACPGTGNGGLTPIQRRQSRRCRPLPATFSGSGQTAGRCHRYEG